MIFLAQVFVDNYLDGGYHVEHLHKALASNLDLSSYSLTVTPRCSVQRARGAAGGDERVGGNAVYAFMYPNLMVNRYGPWLDTNVVMPTGE